MFLEYFTCILHLLSWLNEGPDIRISNPQFLVQSIGDIFSRTFWGNALGYLAAEPSAILRAERRFLKLFLQYNILNIGDQVGDSAQLQHVEKQ